MLDCGKCLDWNAVAWTRAMTYGRCPLMFSQPSVILRLARVGIVVTARLRTGGAACRSETYSGGASRRAMEGRSGGDISTVGHHIPRRIQSR